MKKKIAGFIMISLATIALVIFCSIFFKKNKAADPIESFDGTNVISKFEVNDKYDETREFEFKYRAPGPKGNLIIPIDISKCTQNIKYKIIIDLNNIFNDEDKFNEVYFEGLDLINNCVMKEGEINYDNTEQDIINIELKFKTSMITDVGSSQYKKRISIRVITEPANSGKEITNKSKLSDVVKVGDYVNYDANSNGEYTYKYKENTYSTKDKKIWRVFSVNRESGEVLLTTSVGYNSFNGKNGYSDIIDQLNGISAIYGKGKYAESARSINIEDIENNTTYDKTSYEEKETEYNGTEYTIKYGEEYEVNGYDIDEHSYDIDEKKIYKAKQTYYRFRIRDYAKDDKFGDVIIDDSLIASICTKINKKDKSAYFCLYKIIGNTLSYDLYFSSSYGFGEYSEDCYGKIVPIVTINKDTNTSGKDEVGTWQLCD